MGFFLIKKKGKQKKKKLHPQLFNKIVSYTDHQYLFYKLKLINLFINLRKILSISYITLGEYRDSCMVMFLS